MIPIHTFECYTTMSIGSISVCTRNVIPLNFRVCTQMGSNICTVLSRRTPTSCCSYGISRPKYTDQSVTIISSCSPNTCQRIQGGCLSYCFSRRPNDFEALTVKDLVTNRGSRGRGLEISLACKGMNAKISVPSDGMCSKIKYNMRWPERCASASAGLVFGWVVCCSNSEPVHAEAAYDKKGNEENYDSSHVKFSRGKKVYIDYSVIGIPGDGRCLFRSVAHGACLRSGKSAPTESLQRELADELRTKVANEFIKRREETEWFVEGDFDTYVSNMRKSHVWGGEPELFMASHVLQAPIIVYMYDKDAGGLISIAEYGDEYGKHNPIRVLYHGFGHYDALQIPSNQGPAAGRSKL
ncbi:OTU domain-containing protein At3g57810-like isoform X2 [Cucurbita maxima]|uniref:Ubiquitin thioesterase OTU n=1 Tax=Cucurbita maxima TaxID=3661 RepID=A0A6J1J0U7_CUCMA|nr:OTU domain-containing protein At3g57810-like isoform X2 [Cucurbita maxima]